MKHINKTRVEPRGAEEPQWQLAQVKRALVVRASTEGFGWLTVVRGLGVRTMGKTRLGSDGIDTCRGWRGDI